MHILSFAIQLMHSSREWRMEEDRLDLDQLKQLDAIAHHGSVSAAAEELGYSQPALSRSIQRLERELGCQLFERTKNKVTLNEAGRITLEYAGEILRSDRRLRDRLSLLVNRSRTLRIGTCAPAPLWRLTSLIVERLPGTMIGPVMMSEDEVERAVYNREVDFGITLKPLPLPGIQSVPFMHESLALNIPTTDPLAACESLRFADVDGRRFLVLQDIGFWWDVCVNHLPTSEFVRQSDREVFRKLAESTDALTFVTNAAVSSTPGRTPVPLDDDEAHVTFYVHMSEGVGPELRSAVRQAALQE